jgi:type I restriction enzyme, R subunit
MTTFNEANSVRDFVRDIAVETGWVFVPGQNLRRLNSESFIESSLKSALISNNACIEEDVSRADEVIYQLQSVVNKSRNGSLISANEEFSSWLKSEISMPFGLNGEHVTINLIDYTNPLKNELIVSTEVSFESGKVARRFDIVFWVNGIPLVVGEAKSPVRPAYSWVDAASQIHDDYEKNTPEFFVPNVLSFGTEGKELRYGSVGMPIDLWGPWRLEKNGAKAIGLQMVKEAVHELLTFDSITDMARFFSVFATDNRHRKIKIIARYQQYLGTNAIVERVIQGRIKKGLIWHFQGSGKSLLMVFTAQKLRATPALGAPTVLIVVDRVDLDTQISGTFSAADVPNVVTTDSRQELQALLKAGTRKIIITTIHKFAESEGVLDDRSNIIALVDEAHRTQEGDLGRQMRAALPNAFLFGLTGTPINKRDRNTFYAFGSEEDEGGYLSKYSFSDSIKDGATLPLHFEPRLVDLRIDREKIDAEFKVLVGELTEKEKALLSSQAASTAHLLKAPDRIEKVVADIADHFLTKVAPNGLKAQLVVHDKEACVLYKKAMDKVLPPEFSAIDMSMDARDPQEWRDNYKLDSDSEEKLLERFRDPADQLQILIVTAKLLTGFDAPILQTQYLDKPLRDHTLLQAICRTNRPFPHKTHGLIVDYLGAFDDVAQALLFDDSSIQKVITNISELKIQFPEALQKCLGYFEGVDRGVEGWEGLQAAQAKLPDDETRDAFGGNYSAVSQLWEAISPDNFLGRYRDDYRWLTDVYQSIKPSDHTGKLIWHALGAKTLELINSSVKVEVPRDDLETIIVDSQMLDDLEAKSKDPAQTISTIEIQIVARIARYKDEPLFRELGERLAELKDKYSQGQQASLDFLRELLELARDTVVAEKAIQLIPREEKGKAALTQLFDSIKSEVTPVMVERIVSDIDDVVRAVRFDGWQSTAQGDREVKQALRQTLYVKYKIRDQDLFDRAHEYIREYF